MKKQKALLVICLLYSFCVFSQNSFSGTIYDRVSKEPLYGASVYYEGTTLGTTSNDQGAFTLYSQEQTTSNIVISYLGYQDLILPYNTKQKRFYLTAQAESLGEVIVKSNSAFTRKQMLRAFKQQFLGMTRAGNSCSIKNEDAIYLDFDSDTNTLTADTDAPLIVENSYLGYEIRFTLLTLTTEFYKQSLLNEDVKKSYYAGTSFYTDIKKDNPKFERRRKKTYLGSSLHFMRTIATEQWDKENYVLYQKRYATLPKMVFRTSTNEGIAKVNFKSKADIVYRNKERSIIVPQKEKFTIDGFGNFSPPDAILFGGAMGNQRLGDALPLDFGL